MTGRGHGSRRLPEDAVTARKAGARRPWGALAIDLRQAVRGLRRNPGFAAATVFLLALGVGTSTAMFTVLKATLLDPWPYREAHRIVTVGISYPRMAQDRLEPLSVPEALSVARDSGVFAAVMEGVGRNVNLTDGDRPERVHGVAVSASTFPMLGVPPLLGRVFTAEEDRPGAEPVVVLGNRLWRDRFAADAGIVGRTVAIEGTRYTVVGVMPEHFAWWDAGLYFPLALDLRDTRRAVRSIYVQGRLRPSLTIATAEQRLNALLLRWEAEAGGANPEYRGARFRLSPLREDVVRDLRPALWILLAAAGLVLAAACANVANLFLARAARRQREIAVRRALGAGAGALARLFLSESLLLSALAVAPSLLLSKLLLPWIVARVPYGYIPAEAKIRLDAAALSVAFALAAGTGAALAWLPVRRMFRNERTGRPNALSPAGPATSHAFVSFQVALAIVLVSLSAIVATALRRLSATPIGIRSDRAVAMRLTLPRSVRTPREAAAIFDAAIGRIEVLPSVRAVGAISALPLAAAPEQRLVLEGRAPEESGVVFEADAMVAAGRYLEAAGVALRRGRFFSSGDGADAPAVAVVGETMARRFWPRGDAIGRRFRADRPGSSWRTVVGIAGDVRQASVTASLRPAFYVPAAQADEPARSLALVVSTDRPRATAEAIRAAVRAVDPELPLGAAQPLGELVRDALGGRRLALLLMSVFAGAVVLLSAAGVHAVVAVAISRRTREIGIRMALGSSRSAVARVFVRDAGLAAGVGALAGIGAAAAGSAVLSSVLEGVRPSIGIPVAAALFLAAVALGAAWIPARRGAGVDPMTALRQD